MYAPVGIWLRKTFLSTPPIITITESDFTSGLAPAFAVSSGFFAVSNGFFDVSGCCFVVSRRWVVSCP